MGKVKTSVNTSMVSGGWRFEGKVGFEVLLDLAEEWKEAVRDRYVDLHVRKCNKGQIVIGFKYLFEGNDHKRFFHKVTDQLKRKFGNDFIGYDVSSPTWLIQDPPVKIVVTRGNTDFQARLENHSGLSYHGGSILEALGNLVLMRCDLFDLTLPPNNSSQA